MMTHKLHHTILALIVLAGAGLACNAPLPRTPTPTPAVALPTEARATPELTEPPTATDAAPTPPPEPSEEPSPTPEPVQRIVYTSAGQLWIVEGDLPERQLTAGPGDALPIISPDGQWIVYRHDVDPHPAGPPRFELRLVASDGGSEQVLVHPGDLPGEMGVPFEHDTEVMLDRLPAQVGWLPDSRTIMFNTNIEVGYGLANKEDLWTIDIESGATTSLLPDGQGGVFAISPDGSRVVLGAPDMVSMARSDGSERRTLITFDRVNTASEWAYHPVAAWAPDSSFALVAISSSEPFGPTPSGTIWRLPIDGDAVQLTTLPGEFLFSSVSETMWSADRTRMAYTLLTDAASNTRDLVISHVDGDDLMVYATGELGFLGWSTAGASFTYWQDQPSQIYWGSLGTSPQRLSAPISDAARVIHVHWLGADTVIYTVEEVDTFTIWAEHTDGTLREIASGTGAYPDVDVAW